MSIESRSRQYGKVFDHWQIREFLGSGSGGKSAVFRLVHSGSSSVQSALKVISLIEKRGDFESLSESRKAEYERVKQKCKECAEQEVLLMNGLQGRTNVVDYLDHTFIDWADESGFGCDMLIRMELLKDLRSEIENDRVFSENDILKIGREICTALVLCHSKNILHRDIKPENIFFNDDGNYKLGDFGVSRILSAAPMSKASTGVCTPEYAAPEQMSGKYDTRVDIYSLGLVLYELSNGNLLPFATSSYITEIEVQERMLGKPLPAPRDASKSFAAVILKACAFNPEDRYQTAEDFLAELNYLAGVGPRPVMKVSPVGRGTQKATPAVGGNATQYAASDALPKTTGRETVYADPRPIGNASYQTPVKGKPKVPKTAIIGIVLVITLAIGAAAIWGVGAAADREAIAEIVDEADALANAENYDGAIAKVEEGLDEYPNSDELDDKLKELTGLQTDYEISAIIAGAEELASGADYNGAIEKLEAGLALYPDSATLRDKVTEYTDALAAEVKAQTLSDAKALADAGEYESAMSMIKAAKEAYGTNKEYDEAYAVYHKAYSLEEAKAYVDNGDYASAITLLSNAQKINANDVDLISTYNAYCDSYVASVVTNADAFLAERKMDEALAEVNAALKVLPSNQTLKDKKDELQAAKPIAITSLDQLNAQYWTWNEKTAEDPFGNDYSSSCNYFVKTNQTITPSYVEYRVYGKYSCLSGIISPHADIGERYNGVIQVYADDVLVYTSPTVTQKTDAFPFEVDISGAEYIKIVITLNDMTFSQPYGKVLIADVQLWP